MQRKDRNPQVHHQEDEKDNNLATENDPTAQCRTEKIIKYSSQAKINHYEAIT
jgi:hypothetical protein